MKTLFLNGLMPERHGHFIRRLAAAHTLAGTRLPDLSGVPGATLLPFETGEDLGPEIVAADIPRRLEEGTAQLAAALAEDARRGPRGPGADWDLDGEFIQQTLRGKVAEQLLLGLKFRLFHRRHPVDLVISGSDYAAHSRPIVLAARELGIPTLNLEHGFHFTRTAPEFVRKTGWLPPFFASEFVSVENALEAELLAGELAVFDYPAPRFLALGTPIETVANPDLPREQALASLGLDPQRRQVLLMGSWIEARRIQKLVAGQMDTLQTYRELFAELARREFRHGMQLTIKLHPAEARPAVFPGVRAGLLSLAAEAGLPAPLILKDRLPEVMAAADIIMTMGLSSVLYDAFLLEKPTIAVMPASVRRRARPAWFERGTRPVEFGVCEAVTGGVEAWDRVEAFEIPERRNRFETDCRTFADRYGLQHRPLDAKCDAILAWIAELP